MSSPAIRRTALLLLLAAVAALAYLLYEHSRPPPLPPGLAAGNGRLEAVEVDVATKVGGRLARVEPREGDDVAAGQTVALLDAEELKAQLRAARAQARQAQAATRESQAGMASAGSQRKLAEVTLDRTRQLVGKGYISGQQLDKDQIAMQTADAGMAAAQSRLVESQAAMSAATAKVEALQVTLDDATIKAPIAGRVLYRLAEPGEVLPAGGKVLTLLDMADIHMSIYLPTAEAGKIAVGSPARIVLDALPGQPIPAGVSFVAPRSQFTPKEVETRSEREKLMFRVKVRIDPAWLAKNMPLAKPGMPGLAYVATDPAVAWPPALPAR